LAQGSGAAKRAVHGVSAMLRKFLYGIAVAVAALVVIAFFLPRHVRVERSIEIQAPAATVFEIVNGFQRFNEWSPWYELDPEARYTLEGPASGVGARIAWRSGKANVGSGSQEIVRSEPIDTVQTRLEFDGDETAMAVWTIEPSGDGSRVTWAFETDLGMNPFARYMGLAFDRLIGDDYEKGLANLERLAETSAAAPHADGEAAGATRASSGT
jgi:Polyketide cyclase / dehydrase and lipid transport